MTFILYLPLPSPDGIIGKCLSFSVWMCGCLAKMNDVAYLFTYCMLLRISDAMTRLCMLFAPKNKTTPNAWIICISKIIPHFMCLMFHIVFFYNFDFSFWIVDSSSLIVGNVQCANHVFLIFFQRFEKPVVFCSNRWLHYLCILLFSNCHILLCCIKLTKRKCKKEKTQNLTD